MFSPLISFCPAWKVSVALDKFPLDCHFAQVMGLPHTVRCFIDISGLRQLMPGSLSPGWALLALADAGVPFLVIMGAYERATQSDRVVLGAVDMDKHMERVSVFLELLEYCTGFSWCSHTRGQLMVAEMLRTVSYHVIGLLGV